VVSSSRTKSVSLENGSKSVRALPYWLPIVSVSHEEQTTQMSLSRQETSF
jgi:hypothetical protein